MIEDNMRAQKIDPKKAHYVSFNWAALPNKKSDKCLIIKDDQGAIVGFDCSFPGEIGWFEQ